MLKSLQLKWRWNAAKDHHTLPISRLLARSLLTCDSAMSARSWASSSSCWTFLYLDRWALACSSWKAQSQTLKSSLQFALQIIFHYAVNSLVLTHFELGCCWCNTYLFHVSNTSHSQRPQIDACRISLWAAACPPDPEDGRCSSCPPQSRSSAQQSLFA